MFHLFPDAVKREGLKVPPSATNISRVQDREWGSYGGTERGGGDKAA